MKRWKRPERTASNAAVVALYVFAIAALIIIGSEIIRRYH